MVIASSNVHSETLPDPRLAAKPVEIPQIVVNQVEVSANTPPPVEVPPGALETPESEMPQKVDEALAQ
jgi:hypothetical protein